MQRIGHRLGQRGRAEQRGIAAQKIDRTRVPCRCRECGRERADRGHDGSERGKRSLSASRPHHRLGSQRYARKSRKRRHLCDGEVECNGEAAQQCLSSKMGEQRGAYFRVGDGARASRRDGHSGVRRNDERDGSEVNTRAQPPEVITYRLKHSRIGLYEVARSLFARP